MAPLSSKANALLNKGKLSLTFHMEARVLEPFGLDERRRVVLDA